MASGHLCLVPNGTICPRPGEERLQDLFAIGRVLGLALWFKIPLPLPLNSASCKAILSEPVNQWDVESIDPDFYKHRVATLLKDGGVAWMEEALGSPLCFVSAVTELRPNERELVPGGRGKLVTEANKHEYVQLLCTDYLSGGMEKQIAALLAGFWDVVPIGVLKRADVTSRELALLICGFSELDPVAWKDGSRSIGSTRVLGYFWELVGELNPEERAKLLHFTTGSSQLPVEGFSALKPHFKVEVVGENDGRLPTAHTCFNHLVLPPYGSKEELKGKLIMAVASNAGFGFE